jgi:hypothetical protein
MRTGVQFSKQNDWAFLSQARVSPSSRQIRQISSLEQ